MTEVVNSNTEGQDLLWKDDPIQRLSDAQSKIKKGDELHPKHYINPGILWWAFDWETANTQFSKVMYHPTFKPKGVDEAKRKEGVVLLIDEIDKADPSLPNSLLEVLGNGAFDAPQVDLHDGEKSVDSVGQKGKAPLVIITTNDERELPPAFVRRCLVLNLELPEKEADLVSYLVQRGEEHFTTDDDNPLFGEKVMATAAKQLYQDRQEAAVLGFKPPGQAEYLDMLRVLSRMGLEEEQQLEMLGKIQDFALKKHPGMKQQTNTSEVLDNEGEDDA